MEKYSLTNKLYYCLVLEDTHNMDTVFREVLLTDALRSKVGTPDVQYAKFVGRGVVEIVTIEGATIPSIFE